MRSNYSTSTREVFERKRGDTAAKSHKRGDTVAKSRKMSDSLFGSESLFPTAQSKKSMRELYPQMFPKPRLVIQSLDHPNG